MNLIAVVGALLTLLLGLEPEDRLSSALGAFGRASDGSADEARRNSRSLP